MLTERALLVVDVTELYFVVFAPEFDCEGTKGRIDAVTAIPTGATCALRAAGAPPRHCVGGGARVESGLGAGSESAMVGLRVSVLEWGEG